MNGGKSRVTFLVSIALCYFDDLLARTFLYSGTLCRGWPGQYFQYLYFFRKFRCDSLLIITYFSFGHIWGLILLRHDDFLLRRRALYLNKKLLQESSPRWNQVNATYTDLHFDVSLQGCSCFSLSTQNFCSHQNGHEKFTYGLTADTSET